jgi:hypothetical protein
MMKLKKSTDAARMNSGNIAVATTSRLDVAATDMAAAAVHHAAAAGRPTQLGACR